MVASLREYNEVSRLLKLLSMCYNVKWGDGALKDRWGSPTRLRFHLPQAKVPKKMVIGSNVLKTGSNVGMTCFMLR
eukprot:6454448-Amphidinium_carterae.2